MFWSRHWSLLEANDHRHARVSLLVAQQENNSHKTRKPSSCLNISLPPGGSQWNWHYRQSVEVMMGFIAFGADNSIG